MCSSDLEVMDRYMKRVTALVHEGIQTGRLREDLDAVETARYVTALIQGLVLRWSIYEFSFSLEEEADLLWEFLWSALKPR